MASSKELKNRIASVTNTRKITRTMEMVATSKLKRAQDRVTASTPYLDKLAEMLADLTGQLGAEYAADFPLLAQREDVRRVRLFLVTANRGLCGGYNTNLIRLARDLFKQQQDLGRAVELEIAGKKGNAWFRFQRYDIAKSHLDLSDRPTYEQAAVFADDFADAFLAGRVDAVFIVFAHFLSGARQPPTVLELLPLTERSALRPAPTVAAAKAVAKEGEPAGPPVLPQWLFSPSPAAILETLLPMYLRYTVYRVLIEAVASEQIARRIAMKNATDNAGEMITTLRRRYNRERQAQITQEIAEIVGGAAALE